MPHVDPKGMIPVVQKLKIKYKDLFHLKEYYIALHEWLLENKWSDIDEGSDHWETHYRERIAQGGARELWFRWRVTKTPEGTPLQYYMDMDFHCLAIMDAEIIQDGKKIKLHSGEVELSINAYIDKEYEKAFAKSNLLKQFIGIFNKRVYHKALEQRSKELYQEVYSFQNYIKQWFKLKRYLPYDEARNFFPSVAYPSHLK